MKHISKLLTIVLALTCLAGCGGEKGPTTATVTGKVTLADGSPVTGGRIDFRSVPAGLVSGQIKADGSYEAKDVPLGAQKVSIDNKALKVVGAPSPGITPPPSDLKYVEFDPKFSDPEKSGLTVTIDGTKKTYDVQLK